MTEEPRDPNAQQPPAPEEPAAPAAEADDDAAEGADAAAAGRLAGEPGDEAPAPEPAPQPLPHRLTRSRQERVFGGIAGGVADYFDIDPVLVRIAFVILAIVTRGAFVLLYFAAWIIIPEEAPSTASAGATGEAATPAAPRRRHEHRRHEGVGTGAIVVGVLLILLGAASLMWTLGLRTPPIDAVLAGLLILVGLAILVESRRGVHGGLVVIALILTGILGTAATTAPGFHFDSGFGERSVRPAASADLQSNYSHAFGDLTVDLRNVELPEGDTKVDISIAFGSVEVFVPAGVGVRVRGETVFGSTDAFGREFSGVSVNHDYRSSNYDAAPRRVTIDLSNAFGSAVIR
jgi:phage shock protein PspC (stress-responsive transcriptional regulator)